MDEVLGESRKREVIKRADMSTEGLVGVVNVSRIGIPSLEEGVFPDEVLELIEQRRERIMDKMRSIVEKEEKGELTPGERRHRQVEEIKTTLQVIILEIEKLQVQTGTRCVAECNKMVAELENIKRKILAAEERLGVPYRWLVVAVLGLGLLLYQRNGLGWFTDS